MKGLPHAQRPCTECPWRRDQPPGRFSPERYETLRDTAGTPGREVGFQAPVFACHKSTEGHDLVCAGWLAVVGCEHLGIRLAVAMGRLDPETLSIREGWPELYASYDELARVNGVNPDVNR